MWEFCLACKNENKQILEYINKLISSDLTNCLVTNYSDKNFEYILIAGDNSLQQFFKDKIKHSIVTYIIDVFKYEYFMKTIVGCAQDITTQAYIKSLTLYDVETDVALLNSDIQLGEYFFIDSYISFRLLDTIRMWREVCELVMSNINYLSTDMMLDVIKSFISNFKQSADILKIIFDEQTFELYKLEDGKTPIKLKDKAEDGDVVNYTLLSNPQRIEIYGDPALHYSLVSLLKNLYCGKVKLM